MKTLLLGLGNPILGDDSIGWKVVEQVRTSFNTLEKVRNPAQKSIANDIEFECYSLGGISLMENLIGYDRVWIVDAIHTGYHPIGTVAWEKLEDFKEIPCGHLTSVHDMTLQTALDLGRSIGADLPAEIYVFGIEANIQYEFSDELSEPLQKAFPEVVNHLMTLLKQAGIVPKGT